MSGYNGWTNYETWRINLEMIDGYDVSDFMTGFRFVFPDDRDDAVAKLAEYFCDYVHQFVEEQSSGFAYDLATSFLSHVDWDEIASHYVDDYINEFMYNELKELV